MASSFEKSVKGATKVKLAAPKSKYVEHILIATHAGEAGIAEVFRALNNRLKDQTWTIVFKSLIIVHLMIREGEREVTLRYLRRHPRLIAINNYSDAQQQGRNIRNYSHYLLERARTYGDVRTDYVRSGEGRLRKLSIEKGLLREVECVQTQIEALLQCDILEEEDNEITLLAFRLLVMDLLVLFHVVNEGVINVLEHYFEMSRYDAERALEIYKTFIKQTGGVVEYLQEARAVEAATRLQVPNLKHAPTSLTASLEEYLQDPEFDNNRKLYLAQQEGKTPGTKATGTTPAKLSPKLGQAKTTAAQKFPSPTPAPVQPAASSAQTQPKIAPDLIDFFDTIEAEQTPMFNNMQQQVQQQPLQGPQIQGQFPQQQQQQLLPQQIPVAYGAQPQFNSAPQQMFVAPPGGGAMPMGYPLQNPYPQAVQAQPIPQQPQQPQQVQSNFTGTGFGGYTPQDQTAVSAPPMPAIPQQFAQPIPQPSMGFQASQALSPPSGDTNPFRQSVMMTGATPNSGVPSMASYATSPPTQKSTNPFARKQPSPNSLTANSQFAPPPPSTSPLLQQATSQQAIPIPQQPQQIQQQPLMSAPTGTNPFARNLAATGLQQPIQSPGSVSSVLGVPGSAGGSGTNPFRASMMAQHQQQQTQAQMNGNFSGQTGTMGGWENIETVPVFPRNGAPPNVDGQQQQQGGW